MTDTIVIAGSLAQKPWQGGHTWVLLQYLLGFRRLGWNVLFLDWIAPGMCLDAAGRPTSPARSFNLQYLQSALDHFGLADHYALFDDQGASVAGLGRAQVTDQVERCAFLLNVMGFLSDAEILGRAPKRVFLDIDPGFGQMWQALGLHDPFRGHDAFVTVGARIGQPECPIPTSGLEWIPTSPPVVLDHWPSQPAAVDKCLTSVASWRGAYGPVTFQGRTFGLRVHEFRQFTPLPQCSNRCFRLALDIHPADSRDRDALLANGWTLVDPVAAAGDPWRYRSFVQDSWAEICVAKNMYVQSQSGWISDRSICYLASGRPVLAQDTGLSDRYPTGAGLLLFRTLDEAQDGLERLERDYDSHARAACALAEEYFDSNRVLTQLLNRLNVA